MLEGFGIEGVQAGASGLCLSYKEVSFRHYQPAEQGRPRGGHVQAQAAS